MRQAAAEKPAADGAFGGVVGCRTAGHRDEAEQQQCEATVQYAVHVAHEKTLALR